MESKECTKCHVIKNLCEFYKRNDYVNCYTSHCKECVQARHRSRKVDPVQEGVKTCTRCNIEKPVGDFGPMVTAFDGRKPHCKACHALLNLDYVDRNRDEVNARWRDANPRHAERNRQRRAEDPEFRIKCNLSSRISSSLKARNTKKSVKTIELFGCSPKELCTYLETKFTEGMTWKNYGKWHVDHIRPCVSFNLLNVEEQRQCFHWTNLQPLWAIDNLRKNSRWNGSTIRVRTRPGHTPLNSPNGTDLGVMETRTVFEVGLSGVDDSFAGGVDEERPTGPPGFMAEKIGWKLNNLTREESL